MMGPSESFPATRTVRRSSPFSSIALPNAEERLLKTTLVSRLRAAIADRKLTQIKAAKNSRKNSLPSVSS
jgi:hypothetical protein